MPGKVSGALCTLPKRPPAAGTPNPGWLLVSFRNTVNHFMIPVVRSMDSQNVDTTLLGLR